MSKKGGAGQKKSNYKKITDKKKEGEHSTSLFVTTFLNLSLNDIILRIISR